MNIKQPLMLSTSLLGLTLAMTGCSTTQAVTSTAPHDAKMMVKDGHMAKPHGWHMHKPHDEMRGEPRDGKMGMKRLEALNLTDAQKAQIAQLRSQNQAKMQQLKATLDQYDANIAAQQAAGANTATLLNLYQQKQAAMDQFFAMHQQERQQFINILTPEQQLKMYESQGRGHGGHDGKHDKRPLMSPMPVGTIQK